MKTRLAIALAATTALHAAPPREVSGIYPHLAMFNDEGECGTGAVVPWAGRLWAVTYAPHSPRGSSDKLYEISPALVQTIRPESIGGTPANRMIHRESGQLFIGPYVVDSSGAVRVIPYDKMFGRPTGNARHLTDPAGKIYCASMEEGLYEIDVKTLAVTELWADEQKKEGRHAGLPGYHGKGLYSTQGRIIYANNGDHAPAAKSDPSVPSGVLAEWDGMAEKWTVVRRNQFTEVTGPGGIEGSAPDAPVWAIGWDHRSLILMTRHVGKWDSLRLPKSSHSYDGAHGWNTEWPRIRDIGQRDLLMTMHGAFWRFPRDGSTPQPLSNYLKVVGDFCEWNGRIVLGCDDTAKNEFLNKRKAKGEIAAPQSQSNLWFLKPEQLGALGPAIGRGSVWQNEDVAAGTRTEPFGIAGWKSRVLVIKNGGSEEARIGLGNNEASDLVPITIPPGGVSIRELPDVGSVSLRAGNALRGVTASFHLRAEDLRTAESDAIFNGLAPANTADSIAGTVRARGENKRTLYFLAADGKSLYELDATLNLRRVEDPAAAEFQRTKAAVPAPASFSEDAASIIYTDEKNRRWRLPRGSAEAGIPRGRACREVATERDLFNAGGTFYELPAENAGGFARARAVATHNRAIADYCSYRGLFIVTGVEPGATASQHIIRSADGKVALWVGAIDDIWRFGRPRGTGGPWRDTAVKANVPSDPCILSGFGATTLTLSHKHSAPVWFTVEADITGYGDWAALASPEVAPGAERKETLPAGLAAYWLRVTSSADATASAVLVHE